MASSSEDETVALWNTKTGVLEGILKGHRNAVTCVAWSPDGRLLVSASVDSTVRVWDSLTQEHIATIMGHGKCVEAVAWDGSGKFIASASEKLVLIWDAITYLDVSTLHGHTAGVTSLAFDCTGRYLASGSHDKTVCIWDMQTQQLVVSLSGHSEAVNAVAWDSSGKYIASGSDDHSIRVWDSCSHQNIVILTCVSRHSDEEKDLFGQQKQRQTGGWIVESVRSVAWDNSGNYIACGCCDDSFRIFDVRTKREVFQSHHQDDINAVVFDASGQFFASGSGHRQGYSYCNPAFRSRDNSICLWDAQHILHRKHPDTRQDTLSKQNAYGNVYCFALDSEGKRIASGFGAIMGKNFDIQIWDSCTHQQIALLRGHSDPVTAVAWQFGGRLIASGSRDKTIRIWDALTYEPIATLKGHKIGVAAVAWNSGGKYLASGAAKPVDLIGSFLYDDKQLPPDPAIRIWDTTDPSFPNVSTLYGHTAGVTSLAFDCTGRYLASGSHDKTVCIWDMQTQQLVVSLSGHSEAVNAVAWDSSGKYIASGCREVRIWDFNTHERIITPELNNPEVDYVPPIRAIAFDCAGDYIAVGCCKSLMLFTAKPISNAKLVWSSGWIYSRSYEQSLNAIAFDPSGRYLIANDHEKEGSLRIWNIDVKQPSAFLSGVERTSSSTSSTSVVTSMTSSPGSVSTFQSKDAVIDAKDFLIRPGLLYGSGAVYEGELKDGKENGQGKCTWPCGQVFEGEYKDGKKNGRGKHTWPSGQVFEGKYKDGKKNGRGTLTHPDGRLESGTWLDDKFLG